MKEFIAGVKLSQSFSSIPIPLKHHKRIPPLLNIEKKSNMFLFHFLKAKCCYDVLSTWLTCVLRRAGGLASKIALKIALLLWQFLEVVKTLIKLPIVQTLLSGFVFCAHKILQTLSFLHPYLSNDLSAFLMSVVKDLFVFGHTITFIS